MIVPKCTHWRGHKFQARYSIEDGVDTEMASGQALTAEIVMASKGKRTYERDICVRCGVTVDMVIQIDGAITDENWFREQMKLRAVQEGEL